VAMGLRSRMAQVVLYAFGPFFCYPWKPLLNAAMGCSYEIGYKHFRAQHKAPANVAWHSVCLVFQVLSNFCLLATIDGHLMESFGFRYKWFSLVTAAMWCLSLLSAPCRAGIKLLSACSVCCAYLGAPYVPSGLGLAWLELVSLLGLVIVWIFNALAGGAWRGRETVKFTLVWVLWVGLWYTLALHAGGKYANYSNWAFVAAPSVLILLASLKNPVKPVAVAGAFSTRAMGILTNQKALLFYSMAFSASIMQGTAHEISGEDATLLSETLTMEQDPDRKLAFELAHVTFFPNLLFQAVMESLTTNTRTKKA